MDEQTIIRCFCCDNWVRAGATSVQLTGEDGFAERWCVGCLREVDDFTESIEAGGPSTTSLELEEGESYD